MDVFEVEVSRDLSFLQTHFREVFETDLRVHLSFRAAVKGHFFGQEVRKVRQVGIQVQRQIQQHISQQVIHFSGSGKFAIFGLGRQFVDDYLRHLSFIQPQVSIGIERQVPHFVRQSFIGSFAVLQSQMRLYLWHSVFAQEALYIHLQSDLTVHLNIF